MSIPMGRITGHFSPYKDSRVILVGLISFLIVFGVVFIYLKHKAKKNEEKMRNNMVLLELLDRYNKNHLLNIDRKDIPAEYAAEISDTISMAEHGTRFGLGGHCYAIKYGEKYAGIILLGKGTEDYSDPDEVKGKTFFRIMGFVIDSKYRQMGIGSAALKKAIREIRLEYGNVIFLLECHKDNEKAIRFYEKNGFTNTGLLNKNGTDYFMIMK